MVHISEFTADLIQNDKLKLDPQRNDHLKLTFHDSCNTARGMGILEEPRYIIKNVLPSNFFEMPDNTIREKTFCCGSGSSGSTPTRTWSSGCRAASPGPTRSSSSHEKYGVNQLGCICAIDRATLPTLMEYWVPGGGGHRHHRTGGQRPDIRRTRLERTTDLRDRDLVGFGELAERKPGRKRT